LNFFFTLLLIGQILLPAAIMFYKHFCCFY